MRIRKPFAAAFGILVLLAGYTGLAPISIPYSQYHSDKFLHWIVFFLLTLTFYWIFDTTRRRVLHLTLVTCTLSLSVGSEVLQAILPNHRDFDYYDIAANVVGSLCALGLCAAYHRRMLERKRAARGYRAVSGDEEQALEGEEGVELEEGTGPQVTGVIATGDPQTVDLDRELEQWDENAEDDWDEQGGEDGVAKEHTNGRVKSPSEDEAKTTS